MTGTDAVEISAAPDDLARSVADRLVRQLVALQAQGRVPSVVLTGGSVADRVHRAVLETRGRRDVDWSRVEFWFGDERFVAADDADRNAGQARAAFLSRLPVDPSRVHEMPASDGPYRDDVDAAASAYGDEITRVLGPDPRFDVLMLGVGPDRHCASLFPGHEAVHATGLTVGVHGSPKPPPTRISLTMGTLRRADEVWFVAAGSEKAAAVRDAVAGGDLDVVPAAGPRGRHRTLWLLDADAASRLPHDD
ncbi:MAG: 6-phosphogluconolactonase [Nocardioidaceae bacterium]